MKKYLYILFCAISLNAFAQDSTITPDSLTEEIGLIPESIDSNVDSLLHSWHVQYFSKKNDFCHDDEENVYFPDSVYEERLHRLPRVIPMPYNHVVRDCIELYAGRRRELVRYMLGMADYYFPMIEQKLDEHHLPLELKYLTLVESALNPTAVSRVGATGLWQFMLPTGKSYGLEVNSLVDDRRDPVKATDAACRYLKDLYAVYKDWNLVLASFNCGPGNVNKAIRRSGGKTDFWSIFSYLPRETRSYVPLFIAVNYVMNYYCDHNICPMQTTLPLATDTIVVKDYLHLRQVSEILKVDIEELRALNPQYLRDIVPGTYEQRVLILPAADTYAFTDKADTIFKHRAYELLAAYQPDAPGTLKANNNASENSTRIVYRVRRGETIGHIASRYGVTVRQLKQWNGLRSNRLHRGKRLYIYTNQEESQDEMASSDESSVSKQTARKRNGFVVYKVRSGDSLYSIAKKYRGVTANSIKRSNQLHSTNLHIGQVIRIPVG